MFAVKHKKDAVAIRARLEMAKHGASQVKVLLYLLVAVGWNDAEAKFRISLRHDHLDELMVAFPPTRIMIDGRYNISKRLPKKK